MLSCLSCLTFCDPMHCSPPGSSVHGILQARIVEWVAISFSTGAWAPSYQTSPPGPSHWHMRWGAACPLSEPMVYPLCVYSCCFFCPNAHPPASLSVQTIWDLGSLPRLSLCTALSTLSQRLHSVQFSHSVMSDCLWPQWTAAHQASQSITNSRSLLKLLSIKSVMPSNHLILCRPLLLLPSIFPSIRVFPMELVIRIR